MIVHDLCERFSTMVGASDRVHCAASPVTTMDKNVTNGPVLDEFNDYYLLITIIIDRLYDVRP